MKPAAPGPEPTTTTSKCAVPSDSFVAAIHPLLSEGGAGELSGS